MNRPTLRLAAAASALLALAAVLFAGACSSGKPETAPDSTVISDAAVVSDAYAVPSDSDAAEEAAPLVYAEELIFQLGCSRLAVGHSFGVAVALAPLDADLSTVVWSSSDETIATIDETGNITAVAPGEVYITACSGEAQCGQWLTVIDPGIVYLSPSNEDKAEFSCGGTNESEQMAIIARHCASRLEQCGVQVRIAAPEKSYIDRAAEAADMGAELYVALQADAVLSQVGTTAYFHPMSADGSTLAYHLYNRVSSMTSFYCPDSILSGLPLNLTEIMYPHERGIKTNVIIGIQSRLNADGAQWIVDNAETIGWQIAEGIMDHYAGF